MADDNGSKEIPKPRKPDGRPTPPAMHSIFFWVIILVSIPVAFFVFNQQETRVTLKQSAFEQALVEGRVDAVVVRADPTAGSRRVEGDFRESAQGEVRKFMVEVTYSEHLDGLIRQHCKNFETKQVSTVMTQVIFTLLPIILIVGVLYFLFSRLNKNVGRGAMQFGKSRARLAQSLEKVTFADVAGISEAKEEVTEIIDFLKDPEKFHHLGGHIPKGVLMVGPPGTGKTLLARAIAGEANVPFFNISGSDFVEMFVGVGASRVRDMFEQGKKHAPCIIFIDEIDAVGRSRFSGVGGSHEEREQTLNALLVEMDGFEGKLGVIVVAATNRPDVLDPALLRPGRFDRQIAIDLPDLKGRLEILTVHGRKVKLIDKVNMEIIARGTPGFSGADLANLINEAALLAARRGKKAVDMSDLEEARDKVRWGKERRSRVMDEHERKVTAFHEAGHALVGLHCDHSTPLHKVTIIPRGNAFLGAAMYLPKTDKYNHTRSELLDEITVAMGGRVAEELIFQEITNGAAMDLRMVTNIARHMVCEWGMSGKIGLLHYGAREPGMMRAESLNGDYSEETAREIDQEVRQIITNCYQRATELLTIHREQLVLLGNTLLERETMDADDIRRLLGMPVEVVPDPIATPAAVTPPPAAPATP